ncbi:MULTISPECIES: hypothetical protein [unclassified Halomonas]|uniref:hypothetical protein n=1 Tax=unclassified Halomonas TaxID=2609666 RepID=UPI0007D9443A|nr:MULTISPECIES: hypothetical protein [unclassified Halomonas]MBT2786399.1 hypothetical protein [Halomonas sp. ISL-106]MBT2797421.1 hypothetical protein [Halomonas sp. ISL-104]OAL58785.1 hypothetical protein A6R74_07825 [Halomonas sp. ALS9]
MKIHIPFFKQLLLSTAIASTLFLAGCASTGSSVLSGNNSGRQAADPRLTQGDDAEFFSKSGLQSCAAGAAVGVMGCMLSGTSNHAQCAIIAGISACGVAMGANYYLDQRRSEYASSAERLAVMSQDIQEDTQKVIARTETARLVMAEDRQRIERIEQEIAEQRVNQVSVQRELAGIDSNIGILRRDLSNMQKSVSEYQSVAQLERQEASPAEVQKVEQEIEVMNQQVLALQQEVDDLYSMRSAITLG